MNVRVFKLYLSVIVAIFALSALFVYVEKQNYQLVMDASKGLSERTIHLLEKLKNEKSVKFTVFSRQDSIVADKIKKFFSPFKVINNSIAIEFVDPTTNPSEIKKHAISMQGEMVLSYQDQSQLRKINITELSESAISNAILRLQNQNDEWIVFAERFGMKTINDESDTGISRLLMHLKKSGFNVARMPLDNSMILPENVKLLVLAKPSKVIPSQIVDYLSQLMNKGVSVLWLDDVDASQVSLELVLGSFSGDEIIITDKKNSNYLSKFPPHAITQNFNQPIFIAQAKEISLAEGKAFIETEDNKVIALAKELPNSRLVIVGDSDFISNQYLSSVANKSMIERMIDWLLYHDNRINIPVHINKNTQLVLTQTQLLALSVVFLLAIPLLFFAMAVKWWRKKRA